MEMLRGLILRKPLSLSDPSLRDLSLIAEVPSLLPSLWRPLMQQLQRAYRDRLRTLTVQRYRHIFILSDRDPDLMLEIMVLAAATDDRDASALHQASANRMFADFGGSPPGDPFEDDGSSIRFYVCRRRAALAGLRSGDEERLVEHLVNTLCHLLWANMAQ
jgi:hypothetical protein